MLQIILDKFLLGVSLASPLGPVNAEMIKRGLAYGFWSSFIIRVGASITNSSCLLIAYFGLGQLKKQPTILLILCAIGELVLIYMGIKTIIKACSKKTVIVINNTAIGTTIQSNKPSLKNGLLTGMMVASASPIGIMFWLTSFAASISLEDTIGGPTIVHLLINFVIIIGVLSWGAFVSGILHFCSKIIDNKTLRIVSGLSGVLFIYFGIKYALNTINSL